MSESTPHQSHAPQMPAACARVRARLLDLGAAPPESEEARWDPRLARDLGHMEACAACASEWTQWRAFLAGLQSAEAPSAMELESANQGLMRRLGLETYGASPVPAARRGRSMAWKGRLVPLAVAALALLALGALLTAGDGEHRLRSAFDAGPLASAGRRAWDPDHFSANFVDIWKRSWSAWTDAN